MKSRTINPIVKKVINKFQTIQQIAEVFVTGNSAQRGLLISGDAGTGKSHYVKQAFIKTKTTHKVDYNKSKSFTAAAFYAKLWENRKKGDVVVFDDCTVVIPIVRFFENVVIGFGSKVFTYPLLSSSGGL